MSAWYAGVRVAVPIANGDFTGIIEIERESDQRDEVAFMVLNALEELGRSVQDISLRAIRGDFSAAELGFDDVEVPSTTHHQCGRMDWCDHGEEVDSDFLAQTHDCTFTLAQLYAIRDGLVLLSPGDTEVPAVWEALGEVNKAIGDME